METDILINTVKYENEHGLKHYVLTITRKDKQCEIWINSETYIEINEILMAEYNENHKANDKSRSHKA